MASQCRHQPITLSLVDEVFQTTEVTVYTNGNGEANLKSLAGRTIYEHNGMQDPNPYQQEHDELFASIRAGNVIDDTEMGYESTLAAIMGRTEIGRASCRERG